MKKIVLVAYFLFNSALFAQINNDFRFDSDERTYFIWSEEKQDYDMVEKEYEHSIIEIREIGSKSNGYIMISIVDNGVCRLYHGSIKDYNFRDEKEGIWSIKSKDKRGKVTYNAAEKIITYSFESDDNRYNKVFKFKIRPEVALVPKE